MQTVLDPMRFLLISVAGWMNQQQQFAIDYLREENRVLKEQLGSRRLQLNDDQGRRLAAKAKRLARRVLTEIARIVTAETLLAWHRKLIAVNTTELLSVGQDGRAPPERSRLCWFAWHNRIGIGLPAHTRRALQSGYRIARGTVANILKQHGMEPAPVWNRNTTWKEFLSRHWELIVAADFSPSRSTRWGGTVCVLRGRTGVIWTRSIVASSGAFTRWCSISPTSAI
jgi:hypothetical protein